MQDDSSTYPDSPGKPGLAYPHGVEGGGKLRWDGWQPWPGWQNMLPRIKLENEQWRAKHLPALKAYDEAQRLAREEAAKLEAEKTAALNWCRANGNPHTGGDDGTV
jgi:hypothetical protein